MKLKYFYYISLCFGTIFLLAKILSIPAFLVLLKSQGVSLGTFSQFSTLESITLWSSTIGSVLKGLLITCISLLLIRNKLAPSGLLNTGVIMISISALVIVVASVFGGLGALTYPVVPIIFLISVVLLAAGYIKEQLKQRPHKYSGITFVSVAALIIVFLDLSKIFR